VGAGLGVGYLLTNVATGYVDNLRAAAGGPVAIAAGLLVTAAVLASLLPAARAARVDVLHALRSE
jgi:putative ABC transport system permease protein